MRFSGTQSRGKKEEKKRTPSEEGKHWYNLWRIMGHSGVDVQHMMGQYPEGRTVISASRKVV